MIGKGAKQSPVGELVGARFRIVREASVGGMGTIYEAADTLSGRTVALKVLHDGAPDDVQRFEREGALLAELRAPGIVGYVAHGATSWGRLFLAMEWLVGEDLERRLTRGPLPISDAVALVRRVAEIVDVAHTRGVIHRDIKPSNIFLEEGDLDRVKLLDFGIARLGLGGCRATKTGVVLGTPGYMAPEQVRGLADVGTPADVFSLGCVLFECLTGRPTFEGKSPIAILTRILLDEPPHVADIEPRVPEALEAAVARMLAKAPEDRPKDARAVATLLRSVDVSSVAPQSRRAAVIADGITDAESRFASVLLVGADIDEDAAARVDPAAIGEDATFALAPLLMVARAHKVEARTILGGVVALTSPGFAASEEALRAAACALDVRRVMADAPIALATGRAGDGGRVLLGEAIDRAARLLAIPREGPEGEDAPIRIDEVTAGLIRTRFEVITTRSGPQLARRRDATTRTRLTQRTPCVGRDVELTQLGGLLDEVIEEGVSSAALLIAPTGVGKTRLVEELIERARLRDEPVEVWVARGDPLGAGSAFGLAAQALLATAGIAYGEPAIVREKKLEARVARHVPEASRLRVRAFLGEIIGARLRDGDLAELSASRRDPSLMNQEIKAAFQDFMRAECAAHPVLIVLDDLQWGDAPTTALIDAALSALPDAPLLVVALARPEIDEVFPSLFRERRLHTTRLRDLSAKASAKIARAALGKTVDDQTIDRLVEQAAGNAFYLEELLRAVADGRGEGLPESVLATVEARLDALSLDHRRVLRAASVLGHAFWPGGVAALLGGPDSGADVSDALAALVDGGLVVRREESRFAGEIEHAFKHAMVREAAYAMLTQADRALGHRLAASWLQDAEEADAGVIAEHAERAGMREVAAGFHRRAAQQALDANDFAGAIARADRAIACGAEDAALGALRQLQAKAYAWLGNNAKAEDCAGAAMILLPRGSEAWSLAAIELSTASVRLGHRGRLIAQGRELSALVSEPSVRGAAIGAGAVASAALFHAGEYDLARSLLAACDAAALRVAVTDPSALGRLAQARSRRALADGDSSLYGELCEVSAEAFERAGDRRSATHRRGDAGYAKIAVGAHEEAETLLRAALRDATAMGLSNVAAAAQTNLGWALARQGKLVEAKAEQEKAVVAARALSDRALEGEATLYLARIALFAGDPKGAETQARSAASLVDPAPQLLAYALATQARALLRSGLRDEARAQAERAMALLDRLGTMEQGEAFTRLVLAEALDSTGERDKAIAVLGAARDQLMNEASRIRDEEARTRFLGGAGEHWDILALARAWGIDK